MLKNITTLIPALDTALGGGINYLTTIFVPEDVATEIAQNMRAMYNVLDIDMRVVLHGERQFTGTDVPVYRCVDSYDMQKIARDTQSKKSCTIVLVPIDRTTLRAACANVEARIGNPFDDCKDINGDFHRLVDRHFVSFPNIVLVCDDHALSALTRDGTSKYSSVTHRSRIHAIRIIKHRMSREHPAKVVLDDAPWGKTETVLTCDVNVTNFQQILDVETYEEDGVVKKRPGENTTIRLDFDGGDLHLQTKRESVNIDTAALGALISWCRIPERFRGYTLRLTLDPIEKKEETKTRNPEYERLLETRAILVREWEFFSSADESLLSQETVAEIKAKRAGIQTQIEAVTTKLRLTSEWVFA